MLARSPSWLQQHQPLIALRTTRKKHGVTPESRSP